MSSQVESVRVGSEGLVRLVRDDGGRHVEKVFKKTHAALFRCVEGVLFGRSRNVSAPLIPLFPLANAAEVGYRTPFLFERVFPQDAPCDPALGPLWCHQALKTQGMLIREFGLSSRDCEPTNFAIDGGGRVVYVDYGTRLVSVDEGDACAFNALEYLVGMFALSNKMAFVGKEADLRDLIGRWEELPRISSGPLAAPWTMPLREAILKVKKDDVLDPDFWFSLAAAYPSSIGNPPTDRFVAAFRSQRKGVVAGALDAARRGFGGLTKLAVRGLLRVVAGRVLSAGRWRLVAGYNTYLFTGRRVIAMMEPALTKYDLVSPYLRQLCPARTCLDVGCNNGLFSLAAWQNSASHVVGADIDERALRAPRRLAASSGVNGVEFVCSRVQDIAETPFDITLALALVHHIYVRTAEFGSFNAIFDFLSRRTRVALFAEFVHPCDPNGWRATKNQEKVKVPYTEQNFLRAFRSHFSHVDFIGTTGPWRSLYVGYKEPKDRVSHGVPQ